MVITLKTPPQMELTQHPPACYRQSSTITPEREEAAFNLLTQKWTEDFCCTAVWHLYQVAIRLHFH